jgi:hypothetical protein
VQVRVGKAAEGMPLYLIYWQIAGLELQNASSVECPAQGKHHGVSITSERDCAVAAALLRLFLVGERRLTASVVASAPAPARKKSCEVASALLRSQGGFYLTVQ